MNKKRYIFILVAFLSLFRVEAQVSIVNIQLAPYNITPEAMLAASISNSGDQQAVQMVSKLYNYNGELMLTVNSSVFQLKKGLNMPFDGNRKIGSIQYSEGSQANYIKTTHGLPSGTFKICIDLVQSATMEVADHYCDDIESDFNQFLYLVYPADKDSVESCTPLLLWTHSEPFSLLTQGEYYRMVVTEIKDHQGPDEAITINAPVMGKNYLTTHNFQYPYDAKELKAGKHYAWQVQKISNGVVTNKTEAWEFTITGKKASHENKYAALKKTLDAGYYLAENNKVFFKFEEDYSSNVISCKIYDEKRNMIEPKALNEKKNATPNFKQVGDNRYEIDLDRLNVKEGFHTLEVKSEKGELFLLKFYVQ